MLKKLNVILFSCLISLGLSATTFAEDYYDDDYDVEFDYEDDDAMVSNSAQDESAVAEKVSVQALQDYDTSGSLFEKITMLEQEKLVVQLEKERAQLDLELDRLNAERIKLQMELDTLSGRAEQQQHELEAAKTQLEIQTEKLKKSLYDDESNDEEKIVVKPQIKKEDGNVSKKYKLVNVVGINNQLQATIEEVSTGQNKRIAVGKELDGYIVKSISLNDGIVFEKDGKEESLNIGK